MYFDTKKFSSNFSYAQLVPEAFNNDDFVKNYIRENDGELSVETSKLHVLLLLLFFYI